MYISLPLPLHYTINRHAYAHSHLEKTHNTLNMYKNNTHTHTLAETFTQTNKKAYGSDKQRTMGMLEVQKKYCIQYLQTNILSICLST